MWETLYARTDERKEVGGREVENKRSTPFDCQIVSIACRKKEESLTRPERLMKRRGGQKKRQMQQRKGGSCKH